MPKCLGCGESNGALARFCNGCGAPLTEGTPKGSVPGAERKQVTVLFSDVSGYTSLSERLDPEETREIMARIFRQAADIVGRYGGQIEKFIGDAIMVIFGLPIANEDDPFRAARAAIEMHAMVANLAPEVQQRSGVLVSLHSGINTGVVVTGELKFDRGTAGPLGDTINLAARLMAQATDGQILLGPQTAKLIQDRFVIEAMGPRAFKGKAEAVPVARLVGAARPGLAARHNKAALVGRAEELSSLLAMAEELPLGHSASVALVGEAGSGKSRLVDEFRAQLGGACLWLEGRGYPYTEKTPFFPLLDMLNRFFEIDERDGLREMRTKIDARLTGLGEVGIGIYPSIARLYGIGLAVGESIDREAFQAVLTRAMLQLFGALAQQRPTIVCIQDLHWADGSTVALLQAATQRLGGPVLLLTNHRTEFSPLPGTRVLRLNELSEQQGDEMLRSLLGAAPPKSLKKFVATRAEGNPFFIEEVVLTLKESGALVKDAGGWQFSENFDASSVSPNIQGVIAARIDRLDESQRRVLRHSAVVGREFPYSVIDLAERDLGSATMEALPKSLGDLESVGMILRLGRDAELTYSFKHALTQEVAYNGLLKSDRPAVHLRTARAIERVFADRITEFAEVLAQHYMRAGVVDKAVHYLRASARKSVECYAIAEAAEHYREAFDLLASRSRNAAEDRALIELLVDWSLVFYYQGDCRTWRPLMEAHLCIAEGLGEPALLGLYLGWSGHMLYWHEQYAASLAQLDRAAALGEKSGDERVTAYAQTWRAWTLGALGRPDEAIRAGEAAIALGRKFPLEPYVVFKPLAAIAMAAGVSGDLLRVNEVTRELMAIAERTGNSRARVLAYCSSAVGHLVNLDFDLAVEDGRAAMQASRDTGYRHFSGVFVGFGLSGARRYAELQTLVNDMRHDVERLSHRVTATCFELMEGAALMSQGEPTRGINIMLAIERRPSCPWIQVVARFFLGTAYSLIARGEARASPLVLLRNPGFVLKHALGAKRHAMHYLERVADDPSPDFKGYADDALVELAHLHMKAGDHAAARSRIEQAMVIFERQDAKSGLQKARRLRDSLAVRSGAP